MRNKKGQAAMEFLTTYGWAFLVIIVAVAGLSYFGVFNFSKYLQTSCSLDGKLECGESYALTVDATSNTLAMQIKNNNMQSVEITGLKIIEQSMADTGSTACDGTGSASITSGAIETVTFTITDAAGGCGLVDNDGQKKKFIIEIKYVIGDSGIDSVSTGAITATVQ